MSDNRKPITERDVMFPARIAGKVLEDYVEGAFTDYTFLFKAVVVDVDTVGGVFSGPGTKKENDLPNPKNSIKARIVSKDRYRSDDDLNVFWPMFSHDVMPIAPGEMVYVLFEDANEENRGLWLSRAPDSKEVTNANVVLASDRHKANISAVGLDQAVADTETPPTAIKPSPEVVVEKIPTFKNRPKDRVIEGSNNTIIILGRDRPTDVASGEKQLAGTIQIIAGRSKDEDLDIDKDNSTIYITMKSDIDKNFGTDSVGSAVGPVAAIGLKSDEIRIVARKGMKIVVDGGNLEIQTSGDVNLKSGTKVIIDSPAINVGSANSMEPLVLGNQLVAALTQLLTALKGPVGALGTVPVPASQPLIAATTAIQTLLNSTVLSKKNNTE
jgi:hypothetical protein